MSINRFAVAGQPFWVCGRDTSRVLGNSRQIQLNTSLSMAMNVSRFGLPRRRTMICCRSTMISTSNVARDRNRSTTTPNSNLRRSDIWRSVVRFYRKANRIQFTTGTAACNRDRTVLVEVRDFTRLRGTNCENGCEEKDRRPVYPVFAHRAARTDV